MEVNLENIKQKTRERMSIIRFRTWTLTIAIVFSLIFYFLVQIGTRNAINIIDFIFLSIIQLLAHSLYFPDGELFGEKNEKFILNKTAYNTAATKINTEKKIEKLREYCKVNFEIRKKEYIQTECGALGITEEELCILKTKTKKEISKLVYFTTYDEKDGIKTERLVFFSKSKRKRLSNLLFKPIPVEINKPETIMSGLENNGIYAIKDESISYRIKAYIRKFIFAIIIGGTFAYIGYTLRDGIGIAEITSIIMYLTSLFSTAVMSYSSGEVCSKIYKNNFYVNLTIFIDGFFEWANKQFIPEANETNEN